MLTSLDGYTEDEHGDFGWGAPEDGEVHSYVNELASMALRMTIRIWGQPDPWASVRTFCRGYQRAARLSQAELAQLPELFRLRGAMGTL
jgi:Ser/Thr protein kinase RdoA (MazF antagonist)